MNNASKPKLCVYHGELGTSSYALKTGTKTRSVLETCLEVGLHTKFAKKETPLQERQNKHHFVWLIVSFHVTTKYKTALNACKTKRDIKIYVQL